MFTRSHTRLPRASFAALVAALTLANATVGRAQKSEEAPPGANVDVDVNVDVNVHVQAVDDERPPEEPRDVRPPGTHFLLEANAGANFTGGAGPMGSLLFGAGGKLAGLPLRFYLIGELAYGHGQRELTQLELGGSGHEERSFFDAFIGLRTYLPIGGPLRLFFEAGGGFTRDSASIARPARQTLRGTRLTGLGVLGLGLQVRVLHQLSVGLRLRVRYADDALSDLRDRLGATNPRSRAATATATWHF